MTNYWLYLDDWRTPRQSFTETGDSVYNYDRWKVVKNYEQFVNYTERGLCVHSAWPELVSLDHDLLDNHYHQCASNPIDYQLVQETGWHAARWLLQYARARGLPAPKILVHSANAAGKKNIFQLINTFNK